VAEAKKAVVDMFGVNAKNNPDYSRIISAHEVSRLAGLIDPAKVVIGGKSDPEARYLDPTIPVSHLVGRQDHGRRNLRSNPAHHLVPVVG